MSNDSRWDVSPDVLKLNPELADMLRSSGGRVKFGETSPPSSKRKTKRKKSPLDAKPDLEGAFLEQWKILQKWFTQEHGVTIPDPETQYHFRGVKGDRRVPYRFDFCWPDLMLVVEIEGGTWVKGAHVRGARFTKDATKYNQAAIVGWYVLRFTSDMIEAWTPYQHVREWILFRVDKVRELYPKQGQE